MKRDPNNLRLRELAQKRKSSHHGLYRSAIEKAEIGDDCKRLLLSDGRKGRPRNEAWQLEFIAMLQGQADEKSRQLEYVKAVDMPSVKNALEKAEADFKRAKAAFDKAKVDLENAKAMNGHMLRRYSRQMSEYMHLNQEIANEQKRYKQMSQILLIHPSAKLSALDKRCGHTLVCTAYDGKACCSIADIVEDTSELELFDDEIPIRLIAEFNSDEELKSALEYVKIVLKYYVEDREPKLLYNDERITKILAWQGYVD